MLALIFVNRIITAINELYTGKCAFCHGSNLFEKMCSIIMTTNKVLIDGKT